MELISHSNWKTMFMCAIEDKHNRLDTPLRALIRIFPGHCTNVFLHSRLFFSTHILQYVKYIYTTYDKYIRPSGASEPLPRRTEALIKKFFYFSM